ncbi:MAG: 23S rRNA (uracil(1939)-C(5))-methyltransferase RlmD [Cyanobacteriota bacterium]|nr:23S rRNA (uracil(1939)-C(5))-methyltransferase RlmD [Cyanobacteriota bacterium]
MQQGQGLDGGSLQTLTIDDLTREGVGLGRLRGQVILVDGTVPGDRVQVRLVHQARRHALGKVVTLLQASPDRRNPPCILADHCGGCTLQALEARAQQLWKTTVVEDALQRIGQLPPVVRPLLAAPQELAYRNRAVIPLERVQGGTLRAGYYRRGSHQIVNMNRCPVLDPRLDAMVAPLKADLETSGWPVDRHGAAGSPGSGLRHLALRIGRRSGERLITLIASHGNLDGLAQAAHLWMERWPELVGVTLNIQPEPGNRLFGQETITIRGRGWILEPFCGVELQIGAETFFQVYSEQAERVTALLLEALGPPEGLILEGYCGIGTFSLPLAKSGWRVFGIEQQPSTVALARANAERNGLGEYCRFQQGDVGLLLDQALGENHPRAVVLDPPRKGLQETVVAAIRRHRPPLLFYLSCDPATMARDLKGLCGDGAYRLESVQPLDFFPNTGHVECLAVVRLVGIGEP